MNRYYLIIPFIMFAALTGIYWQQTQQAEKLARDKAAIVSQAKAVEEAKKADDKCHAREDAEKRVAAQLVQEQKKDAEKRAKWEADTARIADDTASYLKQTEESGREVAALELKLNDLRLTKAKLAMEHFEFLHDIELAHIEKRKAELEIQRLTKILTQAALNNTKS